MSCRFSGPSINASPASDARLPAVDVDATLYVFLLLAVVRGHVDLALSLGHFAELHHTIDLADDAVSAACGLRIARYARQTTGDVLGTGGFTRDLGQYIAWETSSPS